MAQQIGLTQNQEEDMNAQIAAGAKTSMNNLNSQIELDNTTQLEMQQVSGQVAADNQAYFAQQESDFNASQGLRDLAIDGEYSVQTGLNQSLQNSLTNLQVPQPNFSVENSPTIGEALNAPVSNSGNDIAPGFAGVPGPMGMWNPIPGLEALADRIPQWGMGALKSGVNAVVAGPPTMLTRFATEPEPNDGIPLWTTDPWAAQEEQQASQYAASQVFNALAWKPSNEGELEGYSAGNDVITVGSLALGGYGLIDLGLSAVAGTDALTLGEVGSSLRQGFGQVADAFPSLSPASLGGAPLRAQLGMLDLSFPGAEAATSLVDSGTTTVTRSVGENAVTYTLDANGNTLSAKGTLLEDFGGGTRSPSEVQAQANAAANGLATDQGGHLVAYRFLPEQGAVNLFPQDANFNLGAFKVLENDYARYIDAGHQVDFSHTLGDFDPITGRPGTVNVDFTVTQPNGQVVDSFSRLFDNTNGQIYVRRAQ